MARLSGTSTAEIDAPIDRVWAVVADVASIAEWQRGIDSVRVLERDAEGRPALVATETDAKAVKVKSRLRFSYGAPQRLSWTGEGGDLKSVTGSWTLEDLGGGRTRASYRLDGETGRMLGLLVRGPVEERMRRILIEAPPGELKRRVEGRRAAG